MGFPKEALPEGWTLEEADDDWAVGIEPGGGRYFLSLEDQLAFPLRENARGEREVDTTEGVPLRDYEESAIHESAER